MNTHSKVTKDKGKHNYLKGEIINLNYTNFFWALIPKDLD